MQEKTRKWNAPYDNELTYTCYELVTDSYAVNVEIMLRKPLGQIAYEGRGQQLDSISHVSDWWVHTPGDESECHYFGRCNLREAIRWNDKQWIIDNLTPDIDDFDARVFARMRVLGNRYTRQEED